MAAIDYEALLRSFAEAHISGIERGYAIGYEDGRRDAIEAERARMNPVISEGTRMRSPQCARELQNRQRGK